MILETFLLSKSLENNEAFTSDFMKTIDTLIIVYCVIIFLYSFGAAKLSWTYNRYLGTSTGMSILWAFLAFLFSSIYYPLYAYAYDPVGKMRKLNGPSISTANIIRHNLNRV